MTAAIRLRGRLCAAGLMLVAAAHPAAYTAEQEDLGRIIHRVGEYVANWGDRASLLVGLEDYQQHYSPAPLGQPPARHLISEFAIIRTTDSTGWIGLRDVGEVDGEPVIDRRDRLERLFLDGAPDAARARAIVEESARFNLGSIVRTVNVPTVALFFFTPANLDRFAFSRGGETTLDDARVLEIRFREKSEPTLIRRMNGRSVRSHGTLWVIPSDGTVVRTSLVVSGFTGSSSMAEVDVRYRRDPRLDLWLPAEMTERYEATVRNPQTRLVEQARATATATYSQFRCFETSARISLR